MGSPALVNVERAVEAGRSLVRALERKGVPVVAAMWLLTEESGYKLYISTPMVQLSGPIRVYEVIQKVVAELPKKHGITFDDVVAANTTNHFINAMKAIFSIGSNSVIELHEYTLNRQEVKHAIVFHLTDDWFSTVKTSAPDEAGNRRARRASQKMKARADA